MTQSELQKSSLLLMWLWPLPQIPRTIVGKASEAQDAQSGSLEKTTRLETVNRSAVAATILIVTTSTPAEVANTNGPSCGASTPLMSWSLSGRTGRQWLYRSLIWPTGRSIAGFHYMGNRDCPGGLTKGRRNTNWAPSPTAIITRISGTVARLGIICTQGPYPWFVPRNRVIVETIMQGRDDKQPIA